MLISYRHRFIFVHIDKAAGTSIQRALQEYAEPKTHNLLRRRLVLLGPVARVGGLSRWLGFREHATARTLRRCLPPEFYNTAFKFAFVRNPWDRLVSRYAYLLRNTRHPRHRFIRKLAGFEAYLDWEIRRGKMFQHPLVTDRDGRLIVDFIGRYESLAADFARVCQRLGLQAELPHANPSPHRDYRDYYTAATRDRVAHEFRRDIEMFGYEFDGVTGPRPVPRVSGGESR